MGRGTKTEVLFTLIIVLFSTQQILAELRKLKEQEELREILQLYLNSILNKQSKSDKFGQISQSRKLSPPDSLTENEVYKLEYHYMTNTGSQNIFPDKKTNAQTNHKSRRKPQHAKKIAEKNLNWYSNHEKSDQLGKRLLQDAETQGIQLQDRSISRQSNNVDIGQYIPGAPVKGFSLLTLGGIIRYPEDFKIKSRNITAPVILHLFNQHSGFCDCLWNTDSSLKALLANSTDVAHYIFISSSDDAFKDAVFMKQRFVDVANKMNSTKAFSTFSKLHFVSQSSYTLGNWLPAVFKQWTCSDHNCGLDQAAIYTPFPHVLPRLDAHYDWLPSPQTVFKNKTLPLKDSYNGCTPNKNVAKKVAVVIDGGCSYFKKVQTMQASGAVGVVVYPLKNGSLQDMNCQEQECATELTIPATMVPLTYDMVTKITAGEDVNITFQNTPGDNFFFALTPNETLAEVGWSLYPSFQFQAWQAQWFDFKMSLDANLSRPATVIPVFNRVTMQGSKGAVASIEMPSSKELEQYTGLELDMSLSCPGTRDESCPAWDHTVQLYVCCDKTSPLCGAELGRWITPFRRRIGRWLTDVSELMPLIQSPTKTCEFTMKTAPWAMPWVPSLNLRLLKKPVKMSDDVVPFDVQVLYQNDNAVFDKKYNTLFTPFTFKVEQDVQKVLAVSVITGHGSDNNGCGEFCVTSHHFTVNGKTFNETFHNPENLVGCADRVPQGVVPNEHGTWLYGRDGWCDGQQVAPWVIDITDNISKTKDNALRYFGWFNGTDPNPTKNPGIMIIHAYLVKYKTMKTNL